MRLEHFRALKLNPDSHAFDLGHLARYQAGKDRARKRKPPYTLTPDFYRSGARRAIDNRDYGHAAELLGFADGLPGDGLVFTVPGLPDPVHDEAPSTFKLGRWV